MHQDSQNILLEKNWLVILSLCAHSMAKKAFNMPGGKVESNLTEVRGVKRDDSLEILQHLLKLRRVELLRG